jgi:RNA polymerase sigma-70 factor (ECF subfamily)
MAVLSGQIVKKPVLKKMSTEKEILVPLVNSAQTGDINSMERLVNLYHKGIYKMVYYRTQSKEDAEDLTQEIFTTAMKKIGRLKNPEKFKSWLYTIAVNRVKDFHRKKKWTIFYDSDTNHIKSLPEDEQTSNPSKRLIKKQFWQTVNACVATLPKMEKEVFMLRFMDQLTIREISEVMNKNENTVKTHLYRALKKFKQNESLHELLEVDV